MLIEHLILQICKITDPEGSFGRKNLTITFLVNNSDFSTAPAELERLRGLSDSMHAFRAKIAPARNRLIGHLDRHSVLDGKALGGADKDEWLQFWLDLQAFLHIMDKHYIPLRPARVSAGRRRFSDPVAGISARAVVGRASRG